MADKCPDGCGCLCHGIEALAALLGREPKPCLFCADLSDEEIVERAKESGLLGSTRNG